MPSSRTRRRRHRAAKRSRSRLQRPHTKPISIRKHAPLFLKIVVGSLGLIASLIAIDSYVSYRLSISSITVLDSRRPFHTRFTISNDGFLRVRNVDLLCIYPKVVYEYNVTS